MVFPPIPSFIDPSNWQQVSHTGPTSGVESHLLPPLLPPPPLSPQPPLQPHGSSSIRPGSMADRARLANIPMQEAPLKCPRCESTNTKFCYFNNYSLTQPRHFCKTCRRYWTRGGALRTVPVGGGCRRNKRSKGSNGASSTSKSEESTSTTSTSIGDHRSSTGINAIISPNIGDHHHQQHMLGLVSGQASPFRFMPSLHTFNEYSGGDGSMGLNYNSVLERGGANDNLSFQMGNALASPAGASCGGGGGGSILSMGGFDQWRMPPPPTLFSGLDSSSTRLYPFEGGLDGSGFGGNQLQQPPKVMLNAAAVAAQLALVKVEENRELNMSMAPLAAVNNPRGDQYWINSTGTNSWTDLSNFNSSSKPL